MKFRFTRKLLQNVLLICLLSLSVKTSFAQGTYYWVGGASGEYSASASWNTTLGGGGTARTTPNTADILIFDLNNRGSGVGAGNITCNNITNETIAQLQIIQGATSTTVRTVTFAGTTTTLTLTGNIIFQEYCTLADGGNTISVGGDIAFGKNNASSTNATVNTTFHSGTGKIQVTGSSSRFYNGNGTTQTTGNFTFSNIEILGSSANLNMTATYNAIQINGTFTINAGKFTITNATANRTFILNSTSSTTPTGLINCLNGGVVVGGGNAGISITGSGPSTGNSSIGTVNFDPTSTTTSTLNNISLSRSNSTLTIGTTNASGLTIAGSIALNAGTLDDGGNTIIVQGGNLFTTTNTTPGNAIHKSTGSGRVRYTRANATSPIFFNSQTTASKCYLEVGNITWAPSSATTGGPLFNSSTATSNISVTLNGSFNFTRNASGSPTITINSKVDTLYVAPTGRISIPVGLTFDFNSKPVIFKSDASNTASFSDISGTLSNATNVTVQQWITGQRGYRVLSNPFNSALTPSAVGTANGITITGTSDVKTYNGVANTWEGSVSSIPANTPYSVFIRGLASEVTGLAYSAGPSAFAYNVTGTLNGSSVSIPTNATGFTLVGNPFAAPVNAIALTGGTDKPFYTYVVPANTAGSEAARTKAGSWVAVASSSSSVPIPMMAAIAYSAGTGAGITVASSAINTSTTATTGLFGEGASLKLLELNIVKDGQKQDNLIVRADANASEAGNESMDLAKLNNDVTNIYTIAPDKTQLAVDARKGIDASIPIGITAPAGSYTFTVANNNLPNVNNVYLLDKLTNTKTVLTPGATYSFDITADAASKGDSRFELGAVKTQIQDVVINDNFSAKVLGNVVNNAVTLQVKGAKSAVQITVTDLQGKLISSATSSKEINTLSLLGGSGMYIIKVTDGDNSILNKVVKP